MRWIIGVLVALSCHPLAPAPGEAQSLLPRPAAIDPVASASSPATAGPFSRWELTLDGQVGVPGGTLQVGETNAPGTSLRLHHDLGIDPCRVAPLFTSLHGMRSGSRSFTSSWTDQRP